MKLSSIYILSLVTVILVCCTKTNVEKTTIKGSFDDSIDPYFLLSKLESVSLKKYSFIDTLFVDKNRQLTYDFQEEPGIYQLKSVDGKNLMLAINLKEEISISKDEDGFHVSGSTDTKKLKEYEAFRKASLNRLVSSVRREIKVLTKEGASEEIIIQKRAEEVSNYEIHLDELADFAEKNLKSSLALVPGSLRWNAKNIELYTRLTEDFKETYGEIAASKQLQEKIDLLEKTAIGAPFPKVEMTDLNGNSIALKFEESELTLIDFWASWCPPCRVESKLLNEIVASHSRTEFNIYGISLDTNRERWKAALDLDQRVWDNVSDLKGLKTPLAIDLGITALPFNFLIDKQGTIVASNIHSEALQKFIEEYLNTIKSL